MLACLPTLTSTGAPHYKIVDLGILRGFTGIRPAAINDKEQIVGYLSNKDDQLHGFVWKDGRFTDLGPGVATQIDRSGQVLMNDNVENFLWDDGVLLPLGEMSSQDNQAVALSDQGEVVGEVTNLGPLNGVYVWRNYETHRLPFQWPNQPSVSWKTSGEEINDRGTVVGCVVPLYWDWQYVFLYQNGKTTLIRPAGDSQAWPVAINNQGWVLGEAKVTNKSIIYAFIWRDGKVTPIGSMTEVSDTTAAAMNDNGQVVGAVKAMKITDRTEANMSSSPFLWQDGHLYDLMKLIVNGAGWTDFELTAMNNKGEIVGTATYQGQTRAFLLTPATK